MSEAKWRQACREFMNDVDGLREEYLAGNLKMYKSDSVEEKAQIFFDLFKEALRHCLVKHGLSLDDAPEKECEHEWIRIAYTSMSVCRKCWEFELSKGLVHYEPCPQSPTGEHEWVSALIHSIPQEFKTICHRCKEVKK